MSYFAGLTHGIKQTRNASAWGLSLALHFVVLLLLSAIALPAILSPEDFKVVSAWADPDRRDDLPVIMTEMSANTDEAVSFRSSGSGAASLAVATATPAIRYEFGEATAPQQFLNVDPSELNQQVGRPGAGRLSGANGAVPAKVVLEQAVTPAGTAGHVTAGLRGTLEQGDTLVVWMLDQSISMQEELAHMAEAMLPEMVAIENNFRRAEAARRESKGSVEDRQAEASLLLHAVVGFGRGINVLQPPTPRGRVAMNSFLQVPIDHSGAENTFSAVRSVIKRFKASGPNAQKNLHIVVWTDESGDDYLLLEDTIADCLRFGVTVSVVGPSAVLGQQRGYHGYVAPETGQLFHLPVSRGPDTSFPQRVRLPYWFRGIPPDYDEAYQGPYHPPGQPIWQGGSNLDSLLSGFPPYALVRLSAQTGGSYTIFDRAGDRPPYDLESLREYLPDYRRFSFVRDELYSDESLRLRRAIVRAVEVTWTESTVRTPQMAFGGNQVTPAMMKIQLPLQLQAELTRLARSEQVVLQALEELQIENAQELYEAEQSPRWRAWYDYSRGRLLATLLRIEEYRVAALTLTRGGLDPNANYVSFLPSRTLLSTSKNADRATEVSDLLNRCVSEHRGTPWELLAAKELGTGLGIAVRQLKLPPPRPAAGGAPPSGGTKVSLPNL
ncbi:vWA domain-containing protein [Stratiformator vulcanicus]|uniref:VWFA domain-containing protein n=1 Tax=Stratiformator vulcanicus TaxID=2527980 RepID=A0A517QYS6_9PLAN|nr:vWA domain-containing protein [Stratiformator vulcanicus]QDT36743.1 hypothetical protein Pan189_11060 [Stratiformator vulcanicus]